MILREFLSYEKSGFIKFRGNPLNLSDKRKSKVEITNNVILFENGKYSISFEGNDSINTYTITVYDDLSKKDIEGFCKDIMDLNCATLHIF